MKPRPWSLARRMSRSFAISMATLVLVVSGLSAGYLNYSIHRELDALVSEKLEQASNLFELSTGSHEDFEEIVKQFEEMNLRENPVPTAWILLDAEIDKDWSRFGHRELLDGIDRFPLDLDHMSVLEGGKCWRVGRMVYGKRIGLLLDGSRHLQLLHSFIVSVLALGGVAAVAAVGCATIYGKRLASMLHDVALSARAVRSPTDGRVSLELANAPTEVLEVAAALREMLVNIEREADKARLIVAGLAHELRSPIQNLLGETEVALLRQRSAEEYRAVVVSHLDELRDLGRVVDNLVLLCATQEAVGARELEDFDLGSQAELRLSKDRDRATQEGLRLELSRLGDLSFRGDREALLLALRNLVTNALKWSPPGGTVRVELAGEGDRLVILVDDAGPGVPPTLRERVFEPFFQGPALHGKRAGYGLGLALTRSAVTAHGGSVRIEDSPLGGARFRVELPRARRPQQQDVA